MKTPTSSAPHIWWNVRRKISPICPPLSLPIAISSTATMIHEARIALPPIHGAKLNCAVILASAPSAGALATTLVRNQLTFGSGDHGPVQAATTTSSTTNGIHACNTSPDFRPWPLSAEASCAASTGTPPYASTVFGCQNFNSSSSPAKQTIAPVTSGRYGPMYTATGY